MKSLYFQVNLPRIALTKALSLLASGICYSRISPLTFGDLPEPELPAQDWVKVRSRMCGICGSDLHLVTLKVDPRITLAAQPKHAPKGALKFLGHEIAGEVVEAGEEARDFKPGDRVTLRTGPSCATQGIEPPCAACAKGHYAICHNRSEARLPGHMGGGCSEFFVVHEAQLFKVPDGLCDEEVSLIEPTACSVHTVLRHRPGDNDRVLIIGGGYIGLVTARAARALAPKCHITVMVKYPFQGDAATRMGADEILYSTERGLYDKVGRLTGGRVYRGKFNNEVILGGFDAVYDCVGNSHTLHHALRWTRGHGTVVLTGVELGFKKFDATPLWNDEIRLLGSEAHGMEHLDGEEISTFDLTARWMLEKKLDVRDLITHRFPLRDFREAMKVMLNRKDSQAIKGVFVLT